MAQQLGFAECQPVSFQLGFAVAVSLNFSVELRKSEPEPVELGKSVGLKIAVGVSFAEFQRQPESVQLGFAERQPVNFAEFVAIGLGVQLRIAVAIAVRGRAAV